MCRWAGLPLTDCQEVLHRFRACDVLELSETYKTRFALPYAAPCRPQDPTINWWIKTTQGEPQTCRDFCLDIDITPSFTGEYRIEPEDEEEDELEGEE